MTMPGKPDRSTINKIQIQMINLQRNTIPIRELDSHSISKLVKVPGIIISASKVKFLITFILHFFFFIYFCVTKCRKK